MAAVVLLLALNLLGSSDEPAMRSPSVRLPRGGVSSEPVVRAGEPSTQDLGSIFEVVDQLPRHDEGSSILVGDADHDHRQEIVLHFLPVVAGQPPVKRFVFNEDDGMGQFNPVHTILEPNGSKLLAMGDIDGDGLTDLFYERSLGTCNNQFVRMEASSPSGFPDHVVWTTPKHGNVWDFHATIADVDGDGLQEFVTSDTDFFCSATRLKVFESAPGDQMNLILSQQIAFDLGNPVVADFDLDGRKEIVVPVGNPGRLHVFEGLANDTIAYLGFLSHPMYNAYQIALVDAFSPDDRPVAFLVGQMDDLDYRVGSYEMFADNQLSQVNETMVPNNCGASIPQIAAADLFGNSTKEILVDRLCDPVPIYSVGFGGALALFDVPMIFESLTIAGTRKTPVHSGAIAVGTFPLGPNPQGHTLVLEIP